MESGIEEAWERASTVFDLGTLELSHVALVQAWERTRPFMTLVSREFRHALGHRVRFEKEHSTEVQLQVDGWRGFLAMKYPSPVPKRGTRVRHRFDALEMALPTGELRLRLRFRLGEGEKSKNAWGMIDWGLGTWGSKKRVGTEAMPVLRQIQERIQDMELESWEGIVRPSGTWGQVGRIMHYTEFGADIEQSVKTLASDFQRLLDAAQPYQVR